MFKKLKPLIYTPAFIAFIYYFVRLYALTFRFKVKHEAEWMALLEKGHTVLLCAWHQQFFGAIRYFKTYEHLMPGLMISRSRDGKLISGVANRTGWYTARGSSSQGGKEALTEMIHHLKEHRFGAQILDGPQGPMGIVKPGVIKMAMESDAVVVPFYIAADRAWFFNSWDRFMLPKPFAKVTLTYGPPIHFPMPEDEKAFEVQRRTLETTMRPYLFIAKPQ